MPYAREFATIELLKLCSDAETLGVDAFALSMIKMERQLRRLFTFSIFQYPCFSDGSIKELKDALAAEEKIYFEGFIKGFEAIHPRAIADLIGSDYTRLRPVLDVITRHRNKIFHGQLTGQDLSRNDLLNHVAFLQDWCRLLGEGARHYMGYEGFDDSFHKVTDTAFVSGYKLTLSSVNDYKKLLKGTLSR
jgi:hypothetical protein